MTNKKRDIYKKYLINSLPQRISNITLFLNNSIQKLYHKRP